MLFTTLEYIAFLAVSVMLYYCIPKKYQWVFLLGISLFFYYSIAGKLIVFLLMSGSTTYLAAQGMYFLIQKEKQQMDAKKSNGASREERQKIKKVWLRYKRGLLLLFLGVNLGALLAFKFYNPGAAALNKLGLYMPLLRIMMPLGVSFYTLQIIGYVVDVYRGQSKPEPNILKTFLFTSYYPQIIQGPISRFGQLHHQLVEPHTFEYNNFVLGCQRILWGYFKKLIIADRLAIITRPLYEGYETYKGAYVLLAACLYTIQLYSDFSGGIDIALGSSQLFGITMTENFNRPLFSKSIPEFWRRWHITLGTWLRDYVLYPLTFSKPLASLGRLFGKKKWRWAAKWIPTYVAVAILWFLSGVWHGEGMQYVSNGLWHGLLILLGTSMEVPIGKFYKITKIRQDSQTLKIFRVVRTFLLVSIGEIMFGASSFTMMKGMLVGLVSTFNPWVLFDGSLFQFGLDWKDFVVAGCAILLLLGVSLASRTTDMRQWINSQELPIRWGILLGGFMIIVIFGIYGPAYDPTPFIYFQF